MLLLEQRGILPFLLESARSNAHLQTSQCWIVSISIAKEFPYIWKIHHIILFSLEDMRSGEPFSGIGEPSQLPFRVSFSMHIMRRQSKGSWFANDRAQNIVGFVYCHSPAHDCSTGRKYLFTCPGKD